MPYVAEKAIPLNAREAMSGSPSPRKVFEIMPSAAIVKERRLYVSVADSEDAWAEDVAIWRSKATVWKDEKWL